MHYDVIIIGAGAAGLMCAAIAGQRGRSVLVLDHSNKAGKKILMSGGGRCNFTNYYIESDRYISRNKHFCKSALSRYTQWDFISLVEKHGIPYHEKQLGELFCDDKSSDILNMLLDECQKAGSEIQLKTRIELIESNESHTNEGDTDLFKLSTNQGNYSCESLVVATGGLSIPTLGATGFGYQLAKQFKLKTYSTRAGLVPFTITDHLKDICSVLSGSSCDVVLECNDQSFRGNMLFTHRGLSGPAILQISSYWNAGDTLKINLLPDIDLALALREAQHERPKLSLKKFMSQWLTQKMSDQLVDVLLPNEFQQDHPIVLSQLNAEQMDKVAQQFNAWEFIPAGTEGYRTAEVTLGGIDTDEVSSKTMMSKRQPGLYFIGEVLDVTGHLGGFNFQWAWASGWAAAQYV